MAGLFNLEVGVTSDDLRAAIMHAMRSADARRLVGPAPEGPHEDVVQRSVMK